MFVRMSETDENDKKVLVFRHPPTHVIHPEHTGRLNTANWDFKPELQTRTLSLQTQVANIFASCNVDSWLKEVNISTQEWFFVHGFYEYKNKADVPSEARIKGIIEAIEKHPMLHRFSELGREALKEESAYITHKARLMDSSPKTEEERLALEAQLPAGRHELLDLYEALCGNRFEAKEYFRQLDMSVDNQMGNSR